MDLNLLYISSNNIYLGFNRSLVLSSTSLVTLTLGGGGTKALIVGSTGKQSISPFEHSIYSYLQRKPTAFGAVW